MTPKTNGVNNTVSLIPIPVYLFLISKSSGYAIVRRTQDPSPYWTGAKFPPSFTEIKIKRGSNVKLSKPPNANFNKGQKCAVKINVS